MGYVRPRHLCFVYICSLCGAGEALEFTGITISHPTRSCSAIGWLIVRRQLLTPSLTTSASPTPAVRRSGTRRTTTNQCIHSAVMVYRYIQPLPLSTGTASCRPCTMCQQLVQSTTRAEAEQRDQCCHVQGVSIWYELR